VLARVCQGALGESLTFGGTIARAANVRAMRSEEILAELERAVENARPVPLTNQVRLDGNEVRKLLAELREALAAERR
jgi:hypothetical protein